MPAPSDGRLPTDRYAAPARCGFPNAHAYAAFLWLLLTLFVLRVLGQALQRWMPLPFLPPHHAFQGSELPYWALLSAQFAILAVMARFCWRVQRGALVPSRNAASLLVWAGGLYMAVALGRIAVGLAVPAAPHWFSTWIPAVFHVVLAGFVLTLSFYHRRGSRLMETQG